MLKVAAAHANAPAVGAALSIVYVIFSLATIWPTLAIAVKRAHDRDWPGPFILLLFVPLVQFWPMIELWFLRGTIGSNRFGADPIPPPKQFIRPRAT